MNAHALDRYQLLAEGGQSKIYCYEDNKVLRVPKREMDFDRIKYEYQVYSCLNGKLPVPQVYDIVDMDGTPCLVMEKIPGKDLYSGIKTNPFSLPFIPDTLARLHTNLFSIRSSGKFMTNHGKARYCIEHSAALSDGLKGKLITLLQSLPDGTTLCHGDFHPGNIIRSSGKKYIIDWSSATVGSPLFDIAHTYLLLMNTPRLDNVADKEFQVQQKITGFIGRKYLKLVCKYNGISMDSLFPFVLIKAGERSFYGMESEKRWLTSFIENTIDKDRIDLPGMKRYGEIEN